MNETAEQLYTLLGTLRRPPVVLCIGSDRVTGDCVGPLVGHMLMQSGAPCVVFGTLRAPVTALNLSETLEIVRSACPSGKVIAVDSCVGAESDLGKIRVLRGSLRPGLACGKTLPKVGDLSVTATVTSGNADNLYSVRLGFVYSLADTIAAAIADACRRRTRIEHTA